MTSRNRRQPAPRIADRKVLCAIRGGIESHLRDLCSELRKSVDLKVIVANDSWRSERESIDGINVLRLPRAMTLASAPICPTMITSIRREKADIVHLHLPIPPPQLHASSHASLAHSSSPGTATSCASAD